MHLPELPTIFVKDGVERKVYFTVEARELSAVGWVKKGEEEKASKVEAEVVQEATEKEKPVTSSRKTTAKKEEAE